MIALLLSVSTALAQPVVYGGAGDGVTDNTAAWNAAQSAICATANRTLIVQSGTYRFLSAPAAPTCAINVQCTGRASTRLVKDYSGGGGYFLKRQQYAADLYGGGSMRDCSLWAGPNSSDGIAVWITAQTDSGGLSATSKNPHAFLLDNVSIGYDVGGGRFSYGVYLDGSANTGPGAVGIRSVNLRQVNASGSTVADIYLYKAVGTTIIGTECYGTPTVLLGVDGGSDSTLIVSRTCTPTIINGVNTYKWP